MAVGTAAATGSPSGAIVLAAVALPFVAAAVVPPAFGVLGDRTGYLGAAVALTCLGLLLSQYGTAGAVALPWVPSVGIALRFYVDGWALLFALLASGMGVLVFTYSAAYMHGEPRLVRYYATLLAFMGSILGIALAADLVVLFLFWELTSVTSFVLIGHHSGDRSSRYAARMAMVVTVSGGLLLLVGILVLALASGTVFGSETFDLVAMLASADAVRASLRAKGLFVPALLLIAGGAAAKSAQVPLHFWLPNAMEAPTPVSAFLHSATMVKVGVYLIGRLRPLLYGLEWTLLFGTLGLATMLVTAVLAVAATDIKELLAYSTASHLGLMVAGFGFGATAGTGAAVFHLLNHALFKAALFLVAGVVAHEAGTRRLDALGGLRRDLPLTALVTVVAALAMAGIPLFNGFYSKELLFETAYEFGHALGGLGWLYPVVAVVASAFTVLYSLRFLGVFFGDRPAELGDVHRPSAVLVTPPALLALGVAVVSVAPGETVHVLVQPAVEVIAVDAHEVHTGFPTSIKPAVLMTAVAISFGVLAYPAYGRLHVGIRGTVAALPPARPSWWYDRTVVDLVRASDALLPRIQNGRLRTYVTWLIAATSALALTGYAVTTVAVPSHGGGLAPPIVVVMLVVVVAAIAVPSAPSHVAGVLIVSVVGLMIAIFYTLASAPDLALTQLVVETLTLLIFLLVLEEVPEYYGDIRRGEAARDAVLSVVIGATVFLTVILSAREPGDRTAIAHYFTEQAVPEGGGTNVVNVILVDFRAFDTLGEIAVLALAALSVLTLVAMRRRGETP